MNHSLDTWRLIHNISDEAYAHLVHIMNTGQSSNLVEYVGETVTARDQVEMASDDGDALLAGPHVSHQNMSFLNDFGTAITGTVQHADDTLLAGSSNLYQNDLFTSGTLLVANAADPAYPTDPADPADSESHIFQHQNDLSRPSLWVEEAFTNNSDLVQGFNLVSHSQLLAQSSESNTILFEQCDPMDHGRTTAREASACIFCWKRKAKVL